MNQETFNLDQCLRLRHHYWIILLWSQLHERELLSSIKTAKNDATFHNKAGVHRRLQLTISGENDAGENGQRLDSRHLSTSFNVFFLVCKHGTAWY